MEDIKTKHQVHVPKRVREYMIELLSTFVAVALAFLSQYFFQYRSDRSTEHDLMVSMVADLRTDIKNIDTLESNIPKLLSTSDEIDNICRGDNKILANQIIIYSDYLIISGYRYQIDFTTSTINQLKNAGGLRLIQNHDVSNAIVKYDNEIHHMDTYQNNLGMRKQQILNLQALLLYSRGLRNYELDSNFISSIYAIKGTALATNAVNDITLFDNTIQVFSNYCTGYANYCKTQKIYAEKLINLIQYHYKID